MCTVVPCYNEAMGTAHSRFLSFARQQAQLFLLFVNDGNTDETAPVVSALVSEVPNRIFLINLAKDGGRAEAGRQGIPSWLFDVELLARLRNTH